MSFKNNSLLYGDLEPCPSPENNMSKAAGIPTGAQEDSEQSVPC